MTVRAPVLLVLAVTALPVAAAWGAPGELDRSFGEDGLVTGRGGSDLSAVAAVAVLPSGRILAGGDRDGRAAVARFGPSGSHDPRFGRAGTSALDVAGSVTGLVIQPDGKLVVAGVAGGEALVARLLGDGALDPTFGDGGIARLRRPGAVDVALQPDGRLLVATAGPAGTGLTRLGPDGTPDPAFGSGGSVDHPGATLAALAPLPDGRIVAVGTEPAAHEGTAFHAALFGADGTPDTAFGSGGRTSFPELGTPAGFPDGRTLTDVAVLPGGQAVATGAWGRFRSDRTAVAISFGEDGVTGPPLGHAGVAAGRAETVVGHVSDAGAAALAVGPDGRVVLVGSASYGSHTRALVARLAPEGLLDRRFGARGAMLLRVPGGRFPAATAVALGPDGRLVVGGHAGGARPAFFLSRHLAGPGSGPAVRLGPAVRTRRGIRLRVRCPLNETGCRVRLALQPGGGTRRARLAGGGARTLEFRMSRRERAASALRRRVTLVGVADDVAGERRRVRRTLAVRRRRT